MTDQLLLSVEICLKASGYRTKLSLSLKIQLLNIEHSVYFEPSKGKLMHFE